jgi:hypothetical protein
VSPMTSNRKKTPRRGILKKHIFEFQLIREEGRQV